MRVHPFHGAPGAAPRGGRRRVPEVQRQTTLSTWTTRLAALSVLAAARRFFKLPAGRTDTRGMWRSLLSSLAIILCCLAAALGGFFLGRSGGPDSASAQRAGAAAGQQAGAQAGASAGRRDGYRAGFSASYNRAYAAAYRRAYRQVARR